MKKIIFLIAFLNATFNSFSQWNYVNSNAPTNSSLDFVTIHEASGICLSGGLGLIKSTNNGDSWVQLNTSLIHRFNDAFILNSSDYIAVGYNTFNNGIITKSTNNGLSWSVTGSSPSQINCISSSVSLLICVGDDGHIIASTNNGDSWNQVPSGTTADLYSVEWDPTQNIWIAGGNNVRLTSTDGYNWIAQITDHSITDIKFRNGLLVETKKYTNNSSVITCSVNGISTNIQTGNHTVLTSVATSDNRILCAGYEDFFLINSSNGQFFTINDSIHGPTSMMAQYAWDIDVCSTFGLAVGNNGALAKYIFANPLNPFVPGDFIHPTEPICPNGIYTATPLFMYADSYNWYLDNVWISNEDTLNSTAPISPGLHNLRLVTNFNGNTTYNTGSLLVQYPPTFPNTNISVDSTLCFEDVVEFHVFNPSGNWNNYFIRLLKNGDVVSDPAVTNFPTQFTSVNVNSSPLNTSDTIVLQLYTTNSCGTYYQSFPYTIEVSPDLSESFEILEADNGVCFPELDLDFTFANTFPGANYTFSNIAYTNSGAIGQGPFYSYTGIGSDTVMVHVNDYQYYPVTPSEDYIYSQTEVVNDVIVEMELNGCHQQLTVFSFTVVNPNASFSINQFPTLVNDQIPITNLQPLSNPNWSILPTITNTTNIQSVTPQLTPDQTGDYTIELVNNESFGCSDTITIKHVVAEPLTQAVSPTCFAVKQPVMHILNSMFDHEGNYIEYGYYTDPFNFLKCNSVIRKYDQDGNLLWDIHPEMSYGDYNSTCMLTTLEVDQDNNLIGSICLNRNINTPPFVFQLISINESFTGNYLVKWNAQGEMIVARPTQSLIIYTDIETLNNKVYFSSPGHILVTDLEFNTIDIIQIAGYHPNTQALEYGSNPSAINEWHWTPDYPRMETLQNGTIAILSDIYPFTTPYSFHIGEYTDQPMFENGQFLYVAILHPDSGFINFRKLFDLENAAIDKTFLKDLCVDEENNIYILTQPQFDDYKIYYEDSLIASAENQHKTSFIVKINSDLETQWIARSSFTDGSIDYSIGNQEIIICGYTEQGIYFGKAQNHHFLGENNPNTLGYFEPGYILINKNGEPNNGNSFGTNDEPNHQKITAALSECGDIYISHSSGPINYTEPMYSYNSYPNVLVLNGTSYNADSNIVFKISDMCSSEDCSILVYNTIDSIELCEYQNSYEVPLYASNNINEIAYSLLQNGVVVNTGYFPVINDLIYTSFPSTDGNYQMMLFDNSDTTLSDTIVIVFKSGILPFSNTTYNIQCNNSIYLVIDTLQFHDISWTYSNMQSNTPTIYLTPQNLIPSDTSYLVINSAGENGCFTQQTLNLIYCHDLNINEIAFSDWNFYPNPVHQTLAFTYVQNRPFEIEIIDSKGKIILKHSFDYNEKKEIDLQSLAQGMYMIRLTDADGSSKTKTLLKD